MSTVDSAGLKNNKGLPVKPDSINYSYKTIDTLNCDSENCYYRTIRYPAIKNESRLNDTLKHKLFNCIGVTYKPNVDFKDFVTSHNKTENDPVDTNEVDGDKLRNPLELDNEITFKLQIKELAVLQFSEELPGGLHHNFNLSFLNWDIKTDKIITPEDIFIKDYKKRLTTIAERVFRKERGLSERGGLGHYNFENDIFALNNNFYITPKGIVYLYNRYEIAPYSEGAIELLIKYSSIKNLLRPNTVVSQFIK